MIINRFWLFHWFIKSNKICLLTLKRRFRDFICFLILMPKEIWWIAYVFLPYIKLRMEMGNLLFMDKSRIQKNKRGKITEVIRFNLIEKEYKIENINWEYVKELTSAKVHQCVFKIPYPEVVLSWLLNKSVY